jgi:hypothetical protein
MIGEKNSLADLQNLYFFQKDTPTPGAGISIVIISLRMKMLKMDDKTNRWVSVKLQLVSQIDHYIRFDN